MAKKKKALEAPAAPVNSLGDLLRAKGLAASQAPAPAAPATAAPQSQVGFADKVVLERTRKGRGGKTVTLVKGLIGDLDALARDLRRHLGCGTSVEGAAVVVQGDQVARVRAWAEARGAPRVVIGS